MAKPALPLKSRVLVLCFDGTTNQYDNDNSNVVRFFSFLAKNDPEQQLTYYQTGIGTYMNSGTVSPIWQWAAKILDEAFAMYLDMHVRDGYRFLMENYLPGDKICLFGFSRGAYTARAVAGLLHKIGLLPKGNLQQIPFAYSLYKKTDKASLQLAAGFKKTFCLHVTVDFIGVWDTISSTGIIYSRILPFTNSNSAIKFFKHAISLDEHRSRFQPNLYHRTAPDEAAAALDPEHASSPIVNKPSTPSKSNVKNLWQSVPFCEAADPVLQSPVSVTNQADPFASSDVVACGDECDVTEVWFVGCHGDVGGGSVTNNVKVTLSDITLRWMVKEVVRSKVGILFDPVTLDEAGLDIAEMAKETKPAQHPASSVNPNSEVQPGDTQRDTMDQVDAKQKIYDQLVINKLWWILEVVPVGFSWQDAVGVWHRKLSVNLGRGRNIYVANPKFHITVKDRMDDAKLKYTPKAVWKKGTEVYVE